MIVCDVCPEDARKPAAMRVRIEMIPSGLVGDAADKLGLSSMISDMFGSAPDHYVDLCRDHMEEAREANKDSLWSQRLGKATHT